MSAIVLKVNSPGGEAMAAFSLNEAIKEAVKVKPVIAHVIGMQASAAYIGLSACSAIFAAHDMCQIGSVGTLSSVLDFSEQLKMEGINLIELYAETSEEKNIEVREAVKGNTKLLQDRVNMFNEKVLQIVKENRPDSNYEAWSLGKIFTAKEAVKVGLIDGIMSFSELINKMSN